jgi:hypothetical protein
MAPNHRLFGCGGSISPYFSWRFLFGVSIKLCCYEFAFSFAFEKSEFICLNRPVTILSHFSLKSDIFLKFLIEINGTLFKHWRNVRFSCGLRKMRRLNNECIIVMYRIRFHLITCLMGNMLVRLLDPAFIRLGLFDYSLMFYRLLNLCSVKWHTALWLCLINHKICETKESWAGLSY